jgi:hypothetical protein
MGTRETRARSRGLSVGLDVVLQQAVAKGAAKGKGKMVMGGRAHSSTSRASSDTAEGGEPVEEIEVPEEEAVEEGEPEPELEREEEAHEGMDTGGADEAASTGHEPPAPALVGIVEGMAMDSAPLEGGDDALPLDEVTSSTPAVQLDSPLTSSSSPDLPPNPIPTLASSKSNAEVASPAADAASPEVASTLPDLPPLPVTATLPSPVSADPISPSPTVEAEAIHDASPVAANGEESVEVNGHEAAVADEVELEPQAVTGELPSSFEEINGEEEGEGPPDVTMDEDEEEVPVVEDVEAVARAYHLSWDRAVHRTDILR